MHNKYRFSFCRVASAVCAAACLATRGAASSLDDALVNRADETKSRVLWLCNAKDHDELLALCRKSLKPHPAQDVQGTCGRDGACECNSCWVRRGGYNVPR